jgi:molybdopterin converting factor small subunit
VTRVRIPPVLREAAGGAKEVDLEGATVGEVLEGLAERFPALRGQLFTPDGALNRFVNVYLDGEDVRYLSELETPAVGRGTIVVLPAMAGGSAPGIPRQLSDNAPRGGSRDPGDPGARPGRPRSPFRACTAPDIRATELRIGRPTRLRPPGSLDGKNAVR